MKYLAIDTSGQNLTVILHVNGKEDYFYDAQCGVNHSVRLMVEIENLVNKNNFNLNEVDFIACVVGAGSFTGIRIGVSTTQALCLAYNKLCLRITSFDTLAYNIDSGNVLAVIDARHNGYYVCGYSDKKVVLEPAYIDGEQLNKLKESYKLVAERELANFDVQVVSLKDGLSKAVKEKVHEVSSIKNLAPLYVRKSQAEEGR